VVWLCNAHHVKNVPGRKTDMSDAEWLAPEFAHEVRWVQCVSGCVLDRS
jgi:hypothetical protein